ncbi:glycosyltransferase family 2 protein [Agrococcus jenensis]|uniref:Galactosyltransferase-like protein n=1 Tax=Agrococcus jenensis TaxID=46353 RepID=A0A3N2APY2_9MICO|nr:galactosyltransferase-related protein [Agrococcus jenensis]ROR65090.1 galactosyltransferase-like protein [Agrococcus jenensis]
MTIATITLASRARAGHLARQQERLQGVPGLERVVVWLDAEPPGDEVPATVVLHVPPAAAGMRLAAARNAGARAAIDRGCDRLVFLDADCVPGDALLDRYDRALRAHPGALLAGPVTYLAEGVAVDAQTDLAALTAPHAARPSPPDGEVHVAAPEDQLLFWSLSFALSASTWRRIGGFDEAYVGYGAEDTDFAMRAQAAPAPLAWVGGAHAYHQHHPTSSPPWQHLDDILRNGGLFADRWGFWPMRGWLEAFEAAGAVERVDGRWRRASVAPR